MAKGTAEGQPTTAAHPQTGPDWRAHTFPWASPPSLLGCLLPLRPVLMSPLGSERTSKAYNQCLLLQLHRVHFCKFLNKNQIPPKRPKKTECSISV